MPTVEELNGGFNLGEWEILPLQGLMRRAQEETSLSPKNIEVLLALARRDGNLITRNELIDEVWQGKAFSDEPIQQQISLQDYPLVQHQFRASMLCQQAALACFCNAGKLHSRFVIWFTKSCETAHSDALFSSL